MTADDSPTGRIITFYSYKGGTGRSMALANAACWLGLQVASSSQRVLVMDWDLEAPGLHRFFDGKGEIGIDKRPGVINYFDALQTKLTECVPLYDELSSDDGWKGLDRELPLSDYLVADVLPGVDLIKAGDFNDRYAELVSTFNWVKFYSTFGKVIESFRSLLAFRYAYCLIDSRTGFTDVSGICTMLMPEKLVTVFTPNRQSLSGVLDLSVKAAAYRRASEDFRPLSIFPLPSRIENAELSLKQEWRKQYQDEFEGTLKGIYQLEKCDLNEYFDEVQLPHVAYYAYGEKIALLEERSDALSLRRTYETFFDRLINQDFAWGEQQEPEPQSAPVETALSISSKEDLFISYSHTDNSPLLAGSAGWVDQMHEALASRLAQLLGEKPRIWRDTKMLGNDSFPDTLSFRLSNTTFLVFVQSPAYINSDWCRKELIAFYEAAKQNKGIKIANKSRIFKVVKTPVEDDYFKSFPEELRILLQESLGYEFFETDRRSGKIREFWPEFGGESLRKFLERLEDLAQDIKEFIKSQQLASSDFGPGGSIYLAETTPDLSDERNEIKRSLQRHDYHVFPDENLPFDTSMFEDKVRGFLDRCTLSIHLIGADHPAIPADDQIMPRLDLQFRLAAERVRKQHELAMIRGDGDPAFSRLIWIPKTLAPKDLIHDQFIAYLENDPGVYENAEVLAGATLEDLKTIIQAKLHRQQQYGTDHAPQIYLICDRQDLDKVKPLRDYLSSQNWDVVLPFDEGGQVVRGHKEKLRSCDAVLIFYGSANTMEWKLRDLQRMDVFRDHKPLLAKGIYVAGPETEQKKSFSTDQALIMKNFGDFTPESIKPFLVSLERR